MDIKEWHFSKTSQRPSSAKPKRLWSGKPQRKSDMAVQSIQGSSLHGKDPYLAGSLQAIPQRKSRSRSPGVYKSSPDQVEKMEKIR